MGVHTCILDPGATCAQCGIESARKAMVMAQTNDSYRDACARIAELERELAEARRELAELEAEHFDAHKHHCETWVNQEMRAAEARDFAEQAMQVGLEECKSLRARVTDLDACLRMLLEYPLANVVRRSDLGRAEKTVNEQAKFNDLAYHEAARGWKSSAEAYLKTVARLAEAERVVEAARYMMVDVSRSPRSVWIVLEEALAAYDAAKDEKEKNT
jgi:vacuolar-type H+-ATPase subunit I/STV1